MLTMQEAISILEEAFGDDTEGFRKVLAHSRKVCEVALRIASAIPEAHVETVRSGALLHDIGRSKVPPGSHSYRHGLEGGAILRKLGLQKLAKIAERHLGGGITKEMIEKQGLDLPLDNFVPETIEEKIITFADKIVSYDKEIPIEKAMSRFREEIGDDAAILIQQLHDELSQRVNKKVYS